jgi:nucleotide-binding universal stress UspA family protein
MKRFKDILCVVGSGKTGRQAIERAVTLAENNQASLSVVSVVERVTTGIGIPHDSPIPADLQAAMVAAHAQNLETLVGPYSSRAEINTRVLIGAPFLEIIREVLRTGRDLVIKSPEPREWLDRLFDSDDMHLLRKCPCPVWLIKPQAPKAFRRILATVDVDAAYPAAEMDTRHALNRQVLELATSLALSEFAELHIAHAWHAIGESAMRGGFMQASEKKVTAYVEQVRRDRAHRLNTLMQEVTGNLGQDALDYLKPQTHLVKGWARKEIPALAKRIDADLVVMGTVARTGISGFLMGNTAETILNQIDCSVLAIKPPDFQTPVTLQD